MHPRIGGADRRKERFRRIEPSQKQRIKAR